MPPIVASAEIGRPAAQVFAYATDPARFSEWQKGVVDGHMDGPADGTQSPAVGAKCVTTRRCLWLVKTKLMSEAGSERLRLTGAFMAGDA